MRDTGSGLVVAADDPGAIADAVRRLVGGEVRADGADLDRFAWPALAARFETEIEAALR